MEDAVAVQDAAAENAAARVCRFRRMLCNRNMLSPEELSGRDFPVWPDNFLKMS